MSEDLSDALIQEVLKSVGAVARVELVDKAEPALRLRAGPRRAEWLVVTSEGSGAKVRREIGTWPQVGVRQAREKASAIATKGADGAVAETLGELLESYRKRHLSQLRSGRGTYRSLRIGLGDLLGRELAIVSRRDLSDAMLDVAVRAPAHANRILAYAKGLFSWAVACGYMEANPALLIRPPTRERARDRTPTLPELAIIWEAAGLLQYPFCQIIRLMILTAARRQEVGSIRVDELDLPHGARDGSWIIPAERSKNRRAIRVPLSPLAREVIEQALGCRSRHPASPFVFTTTGDRPVAGWSKAKARLDRCIAGRPEWELPPWRLHDFRRAFATAASDVLHVAPEVADRCLNHVGSSTTSTISRVYARNEMFDQRRDALERWAGLLQAELDRTKLPSVCPNRAAPCRLSHIDAK